MFIAYKDIQNHIRWHFFDFDFIDKRSNHWHALHLLFQPDQVPLDENLIVCKYVANPLLIDGESCITFVERLVFYRYL